MKSSSRFFWLVLLLLPLVGCRGCKSADDSKDAKKNAEKKKQRLVSDELRTLPYATDFSGNSVKPGHWYQTRHKLKANFGDESLTSTLIEVNAKNTEVSSWDQGPPLEFERGVVLSKGQEKVVEARILQPVTVSSVQDNLGNESKSMSILTRYALRGLGTPLLEESFLLKIMEPYQYNMLVLGRDVSRNTFWRGLDCIVWPKFESNLRYRVTPHRIVDISESELGSSMPSQLAMMTSVSHIVLNDLSLESLSTEQQSALVDWLHFGGTLIINGPDGLSPLENSFLREYSPLKNTATVELSRSAIERLNESWGLRAITEDKVPFRSERAIAILEGELTRESQWIPELEGLIAERLVGRGRVVMTTFPMNDPAFIGWPSYSALIHNAILRKPSRTSELIEGESVLNYKAPFAGTEVSPIHNTRLRIYARDLDNFTNRVDRENYAEDVKGSLARGAKSETVPSPGAWNPESLVAIKSIFALRNSSGIRIPPIGTIVKWLLSYLAVLVPLNWLIFRLMGKVEFAWLAAPVIAVVGAYLIARGAQLDVGFSRSQTTYQFLELHDGYPRGHLSSYHALYTSLTTNYQVVYNEVDGVIAPMKTGNRSALDRSQRLQYRLADEKGAGYQSFPVLSNSIGMLQSEEMRSFSGPLSWDLKENERTISVVNKSDLGVNGIGVFGIDSEGRFCSGWIGDLAPSESRKSSYDFQRSELKWRSEWDAVERTTKPNRFLGDTRESWIDVEMRDLYLGSMIYEICEKYPLQRGEWIAIGWTDKELTKLDLKPVSAQRRSSGVVLMHIRPPSLGGIVHDERLFGTASSEEN